MNVNHIFINRLTEMLALLCLVAAVIILVFSSRPPAGGESLAGLTAREVAREDMERFRSLLLEARQLVDTNRDPDRRLAQLQREFPGRHETWALSARHREAMGMDREALTAYARAVKLQPDYLDEGSGLYLGRRIEALTERVMADLQAARSGPGLDPAGRELLKTAYFLKRRLAGGCE